MKIFLQKLEVKYLRKIIGTVGVPSKQSYHQIVHRKKNCGENDTNFSRIKILRIALVKNNRYHFTDVDKRLFNPHSQINYEPRHIGINAEKY